MAASLNTSREIRTSAPAFSSQTLEEPWAISFPQPVYPGTTTNPTSASSQEGDGTPTSIHGGPTVNSRNDDVNARTNNNTSPTIGFAPFTFYTFATLGVPRWFYTEYRFQEDDGEGGRFDVELQTGRIPASVQWQTVQKEMAKRWKQSMTGNGILVGAAIGVLQLADVSQSIAGRTCAKATLILSGVGLFWGGAYTLIKSDFRARAMRDKWLEASRGHPTYETIEFWMCMAAPLTCLLWAAAFFGFTVIIFIWAAVGGLGELDESSPPSTKAAMVASGVFLTGLALLMLSLMYNSYKMARGR